MQLSNRIPHTRVGVSAITIVCSGGGCAQPPWRKKHIVESAEREAYLEQAVADFRYGNSNVPLDNLEPALRPTVAGLAPSSGSGRLAKAVSGCNDACCQ